MVAACDKSTLGHQGLSQKSMTIQEDNFTEALENRRLFKLYSPPSIRRLPHHVNLPSRPLQP